MLHIYNLYRIVMYIYIYYIYSTIYFIEVICHEYSDMYYIS